MEYQVVLFETGSMIERQLLHAISNFKDLAPKKKQLYVTEFYVFRPEADLLVCVRGQHRASHMGVI